MNSTDLTWKRSALDLRLKDERKDVTLQLARAGEHPGHSAAPVPPTPLPPPLKRFLLLPKGIQETETCLGQVPKQINPVYFGVPSRNFTCRF